MMSPVTTELPPDDFELLPLRPKPRDWPWYWWWHPAHPIGAAIWICVLLAITAYGLRFFGGR